MSKRASSTSSTSARRGGARRAPSELTDALRAAGLRRTAPRVAVLQRLEAASAPVSHGDVAEQLARAGYDRATVYRNLVDLVEAGLVMRRDLGDHVWRFELVRAEGAEQGGDHTRDHPHFLCTDCGDVSCLPEEAVKVVATRGAPRAVGREAVQVQLKGRCDGCAS